MEYFGLRFATKTVAFCNLTFIKNFIMETSVHLGRKVQRIREILGIKQEALAAELGISHQAVSKIEQSELIEEEKLEQIAKALKVNVEAIKSFDEGAAVNFLNNITNNSFDNHSTAMIYQQYINPIEKITELYNDKVALLERLLQSEREKNDLLTSMLNKSE